MRRWIGVLLATLIAATPVLAQDKAADEKGNSRAAQFKELQKDFQKSAEEANKELRKVKTQEEFLKIVDKLGNEYTPRIVKLVESDPKDKVSGDVLFWIINSVPIKEAKLYELLAENWAADKRIKNVCQRMAQSPDDFSGKEYASKLLHKVIDDNKDKDAQGLAFLALAILSKDQSEKKGDAKAAAEAEKQYDKVSKDFADVRLGRDTLGDQAKSSLEDIRKRGVGKKMPNLQSEDLQGGKVQLKDYKGKVVVLDIWATWCGPCKAMIPHERDMVAKLKDKPFALISVSADAKKETLEDFLKSTKMPWMHWWNGQKGGILTELAVQFFPTIYVLDGEGVIRYKHIRGTELEEAVEKLLAEAKDKK